jgi:hypothetical protein
VEQLEDKFQDQQHLEVLEGEAEDHGCQEELPLSFQH